MVKKKYQSKRLTVHKKHKIAKKVKEHNRKERKKERLGHSKKQKDPGIPNSWPFKEELLVQAEQARLAEKASQEEAKELRKKEKKERKLKEREQLQADASGGDIALTPQYVFLQARKELKVSVQKADIVFIVLDARDPQGSRSLSLEDGLIGKANKKVVLLLNKIDLVPSDVAQKWLSYLRRFHPTIPVRALNHSPVDLSGKKKPNKQAKYQAALQERSQQLKDLRDNGDLRALRHFLDDLTKAQDGKQIHAVFVGYPNVGKSTLLNSLKKRNVSEASSAPHTTKRIVEVHYNQTITLLDAPSLDASLSDESAVITRHGIANVFLDDPVPAVQALLERCDGSNLMHTLQLPLFRSHEEFLSKLAIRRGLKRKGGDPDLLAAARFFLRALGNGTLETACNPPSKSKARFELPEWYTELPLAQLTEFESLLFASNEKKEHDPKRTIVINYIAPNHAVGDTTEFDAVMGQRPEDDGLTSEDEEQDEDMDE